MICSVVCPHHTSNHASQVFSAPKFGCFSLQPRHLCFSFWWWNWCDFTGIQLGLRTALCAASFWTTRDWRCTTLVRVRKRASSTVLGTNGRFRVHWLVLFVLIIWIVSARCLTRRRAKSESVPVEQDDMFGKNGSRKVAPCAPGWWLGCEMQCRAPRWLCATWMMMRLITNVSWFGLFPDCTVLWSHQDDDF